MRFYPRRLLPVLRGRLARWPIVVITGARQTGKTTLVRDLLPRAGKLPTAYFSLEDPDERLRLAADGLNHGNKLVILDEIQKQPGLLDTVALLADRKKGHGFLLLASSQVLRLPQVRKTLAGRAAHLELWPLALAERVKGQAAPPTNLDRMWQKGESAVRRLAKHAPRAEAARQWRDRADEHLRGGGYPGPQPLPENERRVWLRELRLTYLERDLADLGAVAHLAQFALAQKLLAARTGQLLSYSQLSRELGVAVNTVKRYVRLLELSYQVVLLPSLLSTKPSHLVRTPKLYWTDPGLARLLTDRMGLEDGPLFETMVMGELLRWLSWQADPPRLHFYRNYRGQEVDFVLHSPQSLLAMQVEASNEAHPGDARLLVHLLNTVRVPGISRKARHLGLVVTRGRTLAPLAPHVWAIPDWRLFGPAE